MKSIRNIAAVAALLASLAPSLLAKDPAHVLPAPQGTNRVSRPQMITPTNWPGYYGELTNDVPTNFPSVGDSAGSIPFEEVPLDTPVDYTYLGSLGEVSVYARNFDFWRSMGELSAGEGSGVTPGASGGTAIGKGAGVTGHDGTAIGSYTAAGKFGTAVGNYLSEASGSYSIALGSDAKATGYESAQIGIGSNPDDRTLQFREWKLVDSTGRIPYDRLPVVRLQRLAEDTVSQWTNAAIVVSNKVLKVNVITTNGVETVYKSDESNAAELASLKAQATALLHRIEALEAGGGASTWNEWAADGTPNPDPGFMTMLNRPATLFASGFAWETSGACSVLCQTGSVAFAASDGDGEFRIGPNSTNFFGFAMGGTMIVGAKCRSIDAATSGRPDGTCSMSYDYLGGDFPTLWFSPSLSVDFAVQEGVVWVDNGDGTATVTAPATTDRGFWYATTTSKIDSVFRSTMPASLEGGVIGATNELPVVYDSVITIQSGGRSYRVPAQEL